MTNNTEVDVLGTDPVGSVDELVLYENDYYVVVTGVLNDPHLFNDGRVTYREGYCVINRQTEVVEHFCVQLPEACFTAAGLANALKSAPWAWSDTVAAALEDDDDDDGMELDDDTPPPITVN
jgi:hypothetical protein